MRLQCTVPVARCCIVEYSCGLRVTVGGLIVQAAHEKKRAIKAKGGFVVRLKTMAFPLPDSSSSSEDEVAEEAKEEKEIEESNSAATMLQKNRRRQEARKELKAKREDKVLWYCSTIPSAKVL
jgi:hypothetical protein